MYSGRFFFQLNGTENVSPPSPTTRDRELVSAPEVRIEPGDLNPRPLTPQSATLPTIPRAGIVSSVFQRIGILKLVKRIFVDNCVASWL